MFSLFVVFIIIWQLSLLLTFRWMQSCFGIRIFLWRLWFLLGVYFVTGCQLRIIWFAVVLLIMILSCVALQKPLIMYFYIVAFLGLFDILYINGLVLLRTSLIVHHITLLSSAMVVAALRCGNQSCIWFGLLLCGKYGKKEITEFSMVKSARYCDSWIKSSYFPSRGWRRNLFIFPSIFMVGGLVSLQCWALVNDYFFPCFCCFLCFFQTCKYCIDVSVFIGTPCTRKDSLIW